MTTGDKFHSYRIAEFDPYHQRRPPARVTGPHCNAASTDGTCPAAATNTVDGVTMCAYHASKNGDTTMIDYMHPREVAYRSWEKLTPAEAAAAFHRDHPEVLAELAALCDDALCRGVTRLGIGMLWEVLRWQRMIAGLPAAGETHRLNNNYRAWYARKLMQDPRFGALFETRSLAS